jgi:hypothetical protein
VLATQEFGTDHGGRAKLEQIDVELSRLEDGPRDNRLKKHAKQHAAQMLRRGPLLAFHRVVHDPMHGVHNEVNVLLDESVHKHLMVDSTDGEVKKKIEIAQENINKEWKDANLPKFIQFGKDNQGAHSHALNGPCIEAVWAKPQLLISTIRHMEPVYTLLEAKNLTPALQAAALGEAANTGPTKGKGKGNGSDKPKKPKRPPKSRGIAWDYQDPDEEGGEGVRFSSNGEVPEAKSKVITTFRPEKCSERGPCVHTDLSTLWDCM